jgi:hypothetical protein
VLNNLASLMKNVRGNYDAADGASLSSSPVLSCLTCCFDRTGYYRRALEMQPRNPRILANYALFLHTVRKDFETVRLPR